MRRSLPRRHSQEDEAPQRRKAPFAADELTSARAGLKEVEEPEVQEEAVVNDTPDSLLDITLADAEDPARHAVEADAELRQLMSEWVRPAVLPMDAP